MSKSKKPAAALPPEEETTKPEGVAGDEEIVSSEGDADHVSTPALDDESLDSDAPPPGDASSSALDELAETGEHPPVDDEAPETELEQPEPEFGEDAPNKHEPIVPTLAEWMAAGYAEPLYYRRFGKNPKRNTPAAMAAPAEQAIPSRRRGAPAPKRTYVVWAHGGLQRNGILYEPGVSLELTEDEAASIGPCVSPAKAPSSGEDEELAGEE